MNGDIHAAELGAIETLQTDQISTLIDNRNHHRLGMFQRFGLRGSDNFLGGRQC